MLIPGYSLPEAAANDSADEHQATAVTLRLGVLGEIALLGGVGAEEPKQYKGILRACRCRVGLFQYPFPEGKDQTDAVIGWLDSGARRAVIDLAVSVPGLQDFAAWCGGQDGWRHRLVAGMVWKDLQADGPATLQEAMLALRPAVGCVQFYLRPEDEPLQVAQQLEPLRGKEGAPDYVELVFVSSERMWSAEEIGELHRGYNVDVQCAAQLEMDHPAPPQAEGAPAQNGTHVAAMPPIKPQETASAGGKVDAASAVVACLRTDREDGLFTTVVTDASGVALGLVYSNAESIRASLRCGRGVYWSRSRGGLWRKGDTSGAWQELLGIALDCDSDALRFTVVQHGTPPAFCHFNRRTCWGQSQGLSHLEETLRSRYASAPPGSYTKRLFEDPTLLRNKLVEEAQELAEAETPDHVASEAADLAYFLLVRCVAAGVGIAEVESHLDRRTLKLKRRPGNAKQERIAAGDKILGPNRQASVSAAQAPQPLSC